MKASEIRVDEHLPSHAFRYVERELFDYPVHKATVEAYERERRDIMGRNRQWPPPEGGRAEGSVSDATHDTMLRLEALDVRTHRARRNVRIVESVIETLDDEQRELVRLKYHQPRHMTNEEVAVQMSMGRSRFYELRQEVVRKFALRMGLL